MSFRVVVIGGGNVATHICKAIAKSDHQLVQIFSRVKSTLLASQLSTVAVDDYDQLSKDADIYIVAVSDTAIDDVVSKLKLSDSRLIVHTAGSISIDKLSVASDRYGAFYPLQTFSKDRNLNFSEVPICIEGCREEVAQEIELFSKSLSNNLYRIDGVQRKQLHLSAVFVCNFVNYLYSVGEQLLEDRDISFDLLKPLIQETASKINDLNPIEAQTGPAVRGDSNVIDKHLEMLSSSDSKVYSLLSDMIYKRYN